MKKILLSLSTVILLAFNTAKAADLNEVPSGKYKLDLAHASIVWKVSHFGMSNYVARFTDFDIALNLDSENYANSTVSATIKTNSISTEYPYPEKKDFNKKLIENAELFNGTKFPEITFKSTKFTPIDKTTAKLEGELTLLGVSKPVTLDVTLNGTMSAHPFAGKPAIGFSATTTIERKDWGMVKYLPNIGNEVAIAIEAEFLFDE